MSKKSKRSQKRKQANPNIPRKATFKASSAPLVMSPTGLQEWTGDTTAQHLGFDNLVPWPPHDLSKPESDAHEAPASEQNVVGPTGRTWPDVIHELFVGGQLGVLFVVGLVIVFGVVLWQDNAAGKWDEWGSILISLRKVGIAAFFLLILFILVKMIVRCRR